MSGNKWISGVSPETLFSEASRIALTDRLNRAMHFLPLAAKRAEEDVENVHQMRVCSRRAVAAIDVFADTLPHRRSTWVRKRLQDIRRSANDARDCDVLMERLTGRPDGTCAEIQALLEFIRRKRRQAQPAIEKMYDKLEKKNFAKRVEKLLRRIRWRSELTAEPSFGEAARLGLAQFVTAFFIAGEADMSDVKTVHQFRIEGKRLRYAMEIYAAVMPPQLRSDLYPQVEKAQEKLGAVNDHAFAAARFDLWLGEVRDEPLTTLLARLRTEEENAVQDARRKFFQWWTPQRAATYHEHFQPLLEAAG